MPILLLTLSLLLLAPAQSWSTEIVVGVPLSAQVESAKKIAWRDASGKRGNDLKFALAGRKFPMQLRGEGWASSGGRKFPLPAVLEQVDDKTYAILRLDMAEYLAGVVPYEMHPDWPDEALKAQAVLARTFALRRIQERRHLGRPFQIVAGVEDQEYRWEPAPQSRIVKLVRATQGGVMRTRSGSLAEVFYHSCSGGMTADAGEIWNKSVAGVVPVEDPHDSVCPDYFWTLAIAPAELGALLGMGAVERIDIVEKGPSGRVTAIAFSDGKNQSQVSGVALRQKLGAARLKSTLFGVRAVDLGGEVVWQFQGSGSGHGVGMSQFGAKVQAEEGKSYREILRFYFPQLQLDD